MVALVCIAACAGCGSSGGAAARPAILRVGMTDYIDSLNPFVGYEDAAYAAWEVEYPALVQYGPGLKIVGDWARSWTHSSNGLVWTFHLRPGRWSDGAPLTAADAVWTGETALRYESGATASYATFLAGIRSFSAPDPSTLVVTYSKPIGDVLANLSQVWILPKHIWARQTGKNGKGLKAYDPADHLPTVTAGPFSITSYQEKGTTVFRRNPHYYGPKPAIGAMTWNYYTNTTSLAADFAEGSLDLAQGVTPGSATYLRSHHGAGIQVAPGDINAELNFNSNPAKPRNRELLDWRVREALEYATPRSQIVNVVFSGYAKPWANIIADGTPAYWLNPAVKPLPYDPAKAAAILTSLGYRMGPGGVRTVPATSGRYAQPAHPMSYGVILPDSLPFNGDREFQILRNAYARIGVHITEVPGGDASSTYSLITAGRYTKFDMSMWYWTGYLDPSFILSIVTKGQWFSNSDTGMDDPTYDAWWRAQASTTDPARRQALVWRMEAYLARLRPYIILASMDTIDAHDRDWSLDSPSLSGYCKCYYVQARKR
jgi:peptide/nickel transport system substrate-binding protein